MSATTTAICPICGGTGWKDVEPDAKVRRVTRCDCTRTDRLQHLLTSARIPPRFQKCTLENFDVTGEGSQHALAKMYAIRFVEKYPLERRGLVLFGPAGVGKTHLAVAIIKALIEQKGERCLFYDYRELLNDIRNSYDRLAEVPQVEVLRPVFETPVLLLDELGAEGNSSSDWVWDTVSYIVNSRYNNEKTTIFTTNYLNAPSAGTQQLTVQQKAAREETLGDRITDRIRSRLLEMCHFLRLDGPDLREPRRRA